MAKASSIPRPVLSLSETRLAAADLLSTTVVLGPSSHCQWQDRVSFPQGTLRTTADCILLAAGANLRSWMRAISNGHPSGGPFKDRRSSTYRASERPAIVSRAEIAETLHKLQKSEYAIQTPQSHETVTKAAPLTQTLE